MDTWSTGCHVTENVGSATPEEDWKKIIPGFIQKRFSMRGPEGDQPVLFLTFFGFSSKL